MKKLKNECNMRSKHRGNVTLDQLLFTRSEK